MVSRLFGIFLSLIYSKIIMTISSLLILIVPILAASGAQVLFKRGVLSLGKIEFSFSGLIFLISRIFHNFWLILGIILFGVSFLFYLFCLSRFQLNVIYPALVSAGIILVVLVSWFLFKEVLFPIQIVGILIIILGIFLLLLPER